MRKNWVANVLQQLQNSTATTPLKLKAPFRQQLIGWTKAAWTSLPAAVVRSGFEKAKIVARQLNRDDDVQQILFDSEPDWELFERLLQEVPVVRHVVDPRRDIDTLAAEDVEIDS
ncbi:hypothetical protein PC116_g21747 [Phytophthora cactorum]|uniref:DDE-1 domain-containing protein n=1 Tax=Phytophthora cactorum TaxID=29920 RepID=A0A329RPH2_9STRA|nr:hypothetical protein Pcac1_g3799 [Phytophthora cactorum]KAG2803713.1 hypothetical protein PC112_g19049 [Phytophthora cactorum]KAG2804813.1 hypothetical protein PC111_g18094 [Phytophthora cactorum]KAG2841630.1 hypothetical protein PC113_g18982 [Phytophthora cactorum]KAG2886355.1 hypothetical protein PC114_g19289 [Phytophthora cactorum]